ncbi:MAG: hypothetical protein RL651_777 [Pseudomonadota bacterium]|jgi:hypothetical protein
MRYLTFLLALISGAAFAQDSAFEREFSKFDKDFERLNTWKAETPASKKLKRAPATQAVTQPAVQEGMTTPLEADAPAADSAKKPVETQEPASVRSSDQHTSLPKGAKVERLSHSDRLGNQISDPEVRKKVQALYKRPDVVVQQYVLPTN